MGSVEFIMGYTGVCITTGVVEFILVVSVFFVPKPKALWESARIFDLMV